MNYDGEIALIDHVHNVVRLNWIDVDDGDRYNLVDNHFETVVLVMFYTKIAIY